MSARFLSTENLTGLVVDLLARKIRVISPTSSGVAGHFRREYRQISSANEVALDGPLPTQSAKAAFLPPTEVLFRFRLRKNDVTISEVPTEFPPTVLLGAPPCDFAAPARVDAVMGWGQKDELYFGRRAATTIIGVACSGGDKACFCTALGLGPDDSRGSDLFLIPTNGGYHAIAVTEKGEALVSEHASRFAPQHSPIDPAFALNARARVESNLETLSSATRQWLAESFQHELWSEIALRCHGCGACASVCPTCHCFDIVDEPRGVDAGERRRNWDNCQSSRFTVHASGHNPRQDQNARFRQRVTHKFSIYPEKFGQILCTGCGRCSRVCSAGMNLAEILATIAQLANASETAKSPSSSESKP